MLELKNQTELQGKLSQDEKMIYLDFEKVQLNKVKSMTIEYVIDDEYGKVQNITVSCSCTTPHIENIPSRNSQTITLGIKRSTKGGFEKFATIKFENNKKKTISLKGTVA